MTTFYPSQPTPSFMKKYTRNVYNRVHHNQFPTNGASDEASLQLQPYRTTPLVLPSAKSNLQKNLPTESYLRHHPNPQMRGPPTHDFSDILMKQKVADSVLHRVVGDQHHAPSGPKVVHKQFNSPIGLYSDNLIESTIKNTVSPVSSQFSPQQSNISASSSSVPSPNGTMNRPQHRPTKIEGYKKTVVYDPTKSATFQALQESNYNGLPSQEVAAPVHPRVFQPNRLVPAKKPVYHTQESFPPPDPMSRHNLNSMGEATDVIHQSGSFKRLMYHVLGESEY